MLFERNFFFAKVASVFQSGFNVSQKVPNRLNTEKILSKSKQNGCLPVNIVFLHIGYVFCRHFVSHSPTLFMLTTASVTASLFGFCGLWTLLVHNESSIIFVCISISSSLRPYHRREFTFPPSFVVNGNSFWVYYRLKSYLICIGLFFNRSFFPNLIFCSILSVFRPILAMSRFVFSFRFVVWSW